MDMKKTFKERKLAKDVFEITFRPLRCSCILSF